MDNNKDNQTCHATISIKQYQVSAQMMVHTSNGTDFFKERLNGGN